MALHIHAVLTEQHSRHLDSALSFQSSKLQSQARAAVKKAVVYVRSRAENMLRSELEAKDRQMATWASELRDSFQAQKDQEIHSIRQGYESKIGTLKQKVLFLQDSPAH
jgi:hypothetical protein